MCINELFHVIKSISLRNRTTIAWSSVLSFCRQQRKGAETGCCNKVAAFLVFYRH